MQYKGHLIEGEFDYVLGQGEGVDILDVFANILEKTEDSVTIERFTNYGRHQLPTVVKPLREFEFEYRRILPQERKSDRKENADTARSKDFALR